MYVYPVSLINRMLPVGIVAFRYIYTCRSHLVQTKHQRNCFNIWVISIILVVSISLSSFCVIYSDKSYFYLKCIGREDFFFEEFKNFNIGVKLVWLLPIYHPFQLLSILAFFAFTFFVPIGYICIYRFRKQMNANLKGLNENKINFRKRSNLVTTKYNLIIWVIEALSLLTIFFSISNIAQILFVSIPSTFSPILYFIGILENREHTRQRVIQIFQETKKEAQPGFH